MERAVDRAIVTLNSIEIGDVERIARRLREARQMLVGLEQPDLVDKLDEAATAIRSGDVPLFRKRIQHVVSRLGHLR